MQTFLGQARRLNLEFDLSCSKSCWKNSDAASASTLWLRNVILRLAYSCAWGTYRTNRRLVYRLPRAIHGHFCYQARDKGSLYLRLRCFPVLAVRLVTFLAFAFVDFRLAFFLGVSIEAIHLKASGLSAHTAHIPLVILLVRFSSSVALIPIP